MLIQPLRFRPIFQSMLWGGHRLRPFFGLPTSSEPTGEAWLLSDVDGHESVVADGPHAGQTLRDLLRIDADSILGTAKLIHGRFPLLLKLIDAKLPLSVQVHPNDAQAHARRPGHNGKTEAWVVLDADPVSSRMYAGFREGMTESRFREAMANKTVPATLHSFVPQPGDCVFLDAGTVHAIGADTFLFEVQQTSDITYRLYDWDRVDAKSGQPRALHIEDGLACSQFERGPCRPARVVRRDEWDILSECPYFTLRRATLTRPLSSDSERTMRVIVGIAGDGMLNGEPLRPGDTVLIPAKSDPIRIEPNGSLTILECRA